MWRRNAQDSEGGAGSSHEGSSMLSPNPISMLVAHFHWPAFSATGSEVAPTKEAGLSHGTVPYALSCPGVGGLTPASKGKREEAPHHRRLQPSRRRGQPHLCKHQVTVTARLVFSLGCSHPSTCVAWVG